MCGIIGVACSGPMTVPQKELFQALLYHDVVRGHHATGIAAIDTNSRDISVRKAALPSYEFLLTPEAQEVFEHKHNYNIYIGHNRFATSGDKTKDEYAHPFHWGDIVGVHNGSLRDKTLLQDHKDFEVDSDNIFYHMAANGLDDTIEKMNGAFSLVWYNKEENTLNFLRNSERPMVVAKLSGGTFVWSSEMGLLRWLVKRHKFLKFDTMKNEKGEDEDYCYHLKEGQHFSVAFEGRQIKRNTLVKKTFPTFKSSYLDGNYGSYGSWPSRSSSNYSVSNETPRECTALSKISKRLKINTVVQVKLVEIYTEDVYSAATFNTDQRRRFVFEYRPYGDLMEKVVMYNLGYEEYFKSIDETNIGEYFYGRIGHAYENKSESSKHLQNIADGSPANTEYGTVITIMQLTQIAPSSYFGFNDKGVKIPVVDSEDETDEDNDVDGNSLEEEALVEKKDNPKPGKSVGIFKNNGSKIVTDAVASFKGNGIILRLANCNLSRGDMIDLTKSNSFSCAECQKKISSVNITNLHVLTQVDEENNKFHYLMCSKKCKDAMAMWIKEDKHSKCIEGYKS